MSAIRCDHEENVTQDAKISDSGYSNSCRNSQSQRSTGSSESRHSSSSGSSGYCGHQPALGTISECPAAGKRKEKEVKKKKGKGEGEGESPPALSAAQEEAAAPPPTSQQTEEFEQPCNVRPPSTDQDALQIAALTQTLTCIKKLKHKENDLDTRSQSRLKIDDRTQEHIINCLKTDDETNEEEMQIVVSMLDGIVLYTSTNMTEVLGFPKNMWVGRSLIDFVHPRHRMSFASHITSVIASSQPECSGSKAKLGGFFCCLRQYRGLKNSGFSVTDKRVSYLPCQLAVTFKELQSSDQESPEMFLVIKTVPVRSAYKYPEECKLSPKFTMRHCSSTLISHVDPEVVQYLGYLPQDLIGKSVLSFYHPEDLPLIKQVYTSVMSEQRQPLKSRPYRFKCQNGGFVLLETEWSAFINPWSRKLEFIISQHSILKGPQFPDVTTPIDLEPVQVSEELMKESKKIEEEIITLLTASVGCSTESAKQQVSKRCKDLANFMETLMDEITRPPELKLDIHMDDEKSFSERDSVMLGEISPHHEYYDSKSSSETPPSYNQLNYKENLQRFFESKPKTTLSDESTELKNEAALINSSSGGEDDKLTAPQNNSSPNIRTSTEGSGGESSGGGQSSSGSGEKGGGGGAEAACVKAQPTRLPVSQPHLGAHLRYNPPILTEKLLNKHNEDMEKQMVQRHRELRNKSGDSKSKEKHKSCFDKQDEIGCQGLKRSGSHSFEGEPFKSIKASHKESQPLQQVPVTTQASSPSTHIPPATSTINLWPSFSVLPSINTRPNLNGAPLASPLVPMYYIPQESRQEARNFHPFVPPQAGGTNNYLPGMLYQPIAMLGPPAPMLYSPLTVFPSPAFPPQPPMKATTNQLPQCTRCEGEGRRRPGSQATSVKAQPGSVATSTSLRQTISEQCKSNPQKGLADGDSFGTSNVYDDSSFYSSYSSFPFLKTDKSDESMKSSQENDGKSEDMSWEKSDWNHGSPKNRPVRMVAPWMEEVVVTPELTLKYQLKERGLEDLLRADIEALGKINQPSLVNDQLCQMYLDLELEGLSKTLTLEESITSSSSDSSPDDPKASNFNAIKKRKKRYMEYEKMAILYEENAPMPPPLEPLPCT